VLFGTTTGGGSSGMGTIFAINTDGTGFTNLHSFSAASHSFVFTNSEGADPQAGLILSSSTLYGTAQRGGFFGEGTVFKVNTDGKCFTNLHNFSAGAQNFSYEITNRDGRLPLAGLIISGNTLYGTAESGGTFGAGTVFAINTDGTTFTNLHSFTMPAGPGTNRDGAFPEAGLILSGHTLYGTTYNGGAFGGGVAYGINTDGTGLTNLFDFGLSDGFDIDTGLILADNTLYGTTTEGGSASAGAVFSLTLPAPPKLSITTSGTNVILTWPTSSIVFILQTSTGLGLSVVWTNNFPAPILGNGQNIVTNAISTTPQFYRLSR
jgi:uncharacterized repeat protein (TIGR03803 family)